MRRFKKKWDLCVWLLVLSPPTGGGTKNIGTKNILNPFRAHGAINACGRSIFPAPVVAAIYRETVQRSTRCICSTCVQRSTVSSHYCALVIPSLQIYPGEEEFSPGGFGIFHRTPENLGPRRGMPTELSVSLTTPPVEHSSPSLFQIDASQHAAPCYCNPLCLVTTLLHLRFGSQRSRKLPLGLSDEAI